MKKTLIALFALVCLPAAAWTDIGPATEFTLDGTTTTDHRLIIDGTGGAGTAITITTTTDVTIGSLDGNSTQYITSTTFNVTGTLTIGGVDGAAANVGRGENHQTILTLGDTGNIVADGVNFSSITNTSLISITANLSTGETYRNLLSATGTGKFINAAAITLNVTSTDNYTYGGLIYEYNGNYYNSSDVSNVKGRLTIADSAIALDLNHLTEKKMFGVVSAYDLDAGKPVFNQISLVVIPEPATATLSLLALAGLAARRRRK